MSPTDERPRADSTEPPIAIYGAGGFAKAVADAIVAGGGTLLGFLDDNPARVGTTHFGHPVLPATALDEEDRPLRPHAVVAIGDNQSRLKAAERLRGAGVRLATVVDPAACVAPSAALGRGCMVLAGVVVGPDVILGDNCILNIGSLVEHDAFIGPGAHLSSGSVICGGARVGEGARLGARSVVTPGRAVEPWTTLAAGTVSGAE